MKFINSIGKRALDVVRHPPWLASSDPVYVFHHIPKCGGTSLIKVLDSWFITVRDYRAGYTMHYPDKADMRRLRSCHCLCGHFEFDGYFLHQRYPEVIKSNRYRVFTFVRDPLEVQLSLFRYEKLSDKSAAKGVEEHLFLRPNYLANIFPATLDNYKDVIDRYFFVGILEESEASVATLASMMGKRLKPFPWLNKSRNDVRNISSTEEIPQELIIRFKNENVLDYLIYDYCVERFKKLSAEQGTASTQ